MNEKEAGDGPFYKKRRKVTANQNLAQKLIKQMPYSKTSECTLTM